MVMALVVLTFVVFIALDYFVFSRQRAEATSPAHVPRPALQLQQALPAGVYLQPGFTWSRFGAAGEAYVGVHPLLVGLVGDACGFEFLDQGTRVAKGAPLVRLERAGRRLTVRSPLTGRIELVNRAARGEARWDGLEGDRAGWLYRIRPDAAAEEVPRWFSGEQAAEWTRRQYGQLRDFLHDTLADGHLGYTMADGGELPVGILEDMDPGVWAALEQRFLSQVG